MGKSFSFFMPEGSNYVSHYCRMNNGIRVILSNTLLVCFWGIFPILREFIWVIFPSWGVGRFTFLSGILDNHGAPRATGRRH
jgi:hypothetical protein